MKFEIANDEACPMCGAFWGHPDEALDFPNRSKVADEDGLWWWRCYNPACDVSYYQPENGWYDVVDRTEVTCEVCGTELEKWQSTQQPMFGDLPDEERHTVCNPRYLREEDNKRANECRREAAQRWPEPKMNIQLTTITTEGTTTKQIEI